MPEPRERKSSDKIKGKGGGKSGPAKKDLRRQMTAKFQKELIQQQKGRDTGGSTDTAPEVQAAEQVEEKIYTTADSLREHTADAVSKSISRHRRKQQKKRTEQPPGETPPADAETPPSPTGKRPKERTADGIRTRPPEESHPPSASLREQRPDMIRERPPASRPGRERPAGEQPRPGVKRTGDIPRSGTKPTAASRPSATRRTAAASRPGTKPTAAEAPRPGVEVPPAPKERMRQNAVKEKWKGPAEIRRRPASPQARPISTSIHENGKPGPLQPKPQERMREKAVADAQRSHGRRGGIGPTREAPPLDRPPAPKGSIPSKAVSLDGQSINPIHPIKERPRRSFAWKEKPPGGALVPKTHQSAAMPRPSVKPIPPARKGKAAAVH